MSEKKEIIEGNKLVGVVYQIRNLLNGKIYIGSSSVYHKRKKRHFESLKQGVHHSVPLQRAYNKYGKAAFIIEVLERLKAIGKDDIVKREQFYIDAMKPEYNICLTAGSQLGAKRSDEFKKKCSDRMKGKPSWNKGLKLPSQSEDTKNKRAASLTGGRRSNETRKLMSDKAKGRKFTTEHKIKLSNAKIKHGRYSFWKSANC